MVYVTEDSSRTLSAEGHPIEEGLSDAFPYSLLLHPSQKFHQISNFNHPNHIDSTQQLLSNLSTVVPYSTYDRVVSRDSLSEEPMQFFPLHKASETPEFVPTVPVKLFVNRVPKWMCSDSLRSLFSNYGEIMECYILKDFDGHKGCAFVKFASIVDAHKAISDFHGKKTLNKDAGPVQLKYADGEIERLGLSPDVQPGGEAVKVFVGCLPKSCTEEKLFSIFSRFGRVDEVFLIRDENKQSKCSAFVTFPKMDMALSAIETLDRHYTLPSGKRPIEVRLAKSKLSKQRNSKLFTGAFSYADITAGSSYSSKHCPYLSKEGSLPLVPSSTPPVCTSYDSSNLPSYLPLLSATPSVSPTPAAFSPQSDLPGFPLMNSNLSSSLPGNNELYSPYSNWMEYHLPNWNNFYYNNSNALSTWTPSLPREWPSGAPPGYYVTPASLNGRSSLGETSIPSSQLGTPACGLIEDALVSPDHVVREGNGIVSSYTHVASATQQPYISRSQSLVKDFSGISSASGLSASVRSTAATSTAPTEGSNGTNAMFSSLAQRRNMEELPLVASLLRVTPLLSANASLPNSVPSPSELQMALASSRFTNTSTSSNGYPLTALEEVINSSSNATSSPVASTAARDSSHTCCINPSIQG
ncbi:hypothetical protein IE077_003283, partial [Cardiosporidium cionae]